MRRITSLATLVSAAVLALAGCGPDKDGAAPLPAPAGVSVQAGSATSVHVMWRPAGGRTGVTNYEVYRGGTRVKAVPAGTTMTDITGLEPSTPYTFTVRARDTEGRLSPHSGKEAVTTPAAVAADTEAPARPAGLRGGSDGPRGARLAWSGPEDGQGITSYDIYQSGSKIHSVGGDATTAQLGRLRPGTRYTFTIAARDAADNISQVSRSVRVTTPNGPGDDPDTAPVALRATTHTAAGAHYLDLSWQPPRSGPDAPAYQIYLDGKFATTLIWGADVPRGRAAYSVYAGKEPDTEYRVKLRAKLPDGNWGRFSTERTVVTGSRLP